MRLAAAIALLTAVVGCGTRLFQQYEYEEDLYLSLDGSATIYVNSSLPALNLLRGTAFDTGLSTPFERDAVLAYFGTPETRVTRVTTSERNGRRFVHVRIAVDDVAAMGRAAPVAWSSYRFGTEGELVSFQQSVRGTEAEGPLPSGWTGNELVAFRVHVPSRVVYHNAGPGNLRRGNILVWEQAMAGRLRGTPLDIDVRMEPASILYLTLWLFGAAAMAVALTFGGLIWWIVRRP